MPIVRTLDPSHNFLGLSRDASSFERAHAVVLPVPYEATVSFGKGTSRGPKAILDASRQVEFFDEETKREIGEEVGIATLPPLQLKGKKNEAALQIIHDAVRGLIDQRKFVAVLGGEHTISSAVIAAHAKHFPDLSVLHFDAHSDLRPEYHGNPYSHASAMARVCEFIEPRRLVQVGIRAQCREEAEFIREHEVRTFYAHEIRNRSLSRVLKEWDDLVVEALGELVYVTFDVDAFDPSIMPSTGTPEPGGLFWNEVLTCLRKVSRKKRIVGFDVVEFAPIKGLSHPDVTAAKLVSKLFNYAL
jgi:agmatinase